MKYHIRLKNVKMNAFINNQKRRITLTNTRKSCYPAVMGENKGAISMFNVNNFTSERQQPYNSKSFCFRSKDDLDTVIPTPDSFGTIDTLESVVNRVVNNESSFTCNSSSNNVKMYWIPNKPITDYSEIVAQYIHPAEFGAFQDVYLNNQRFGVRFLNGKRTVEEKHSMIKELYMMEIWYCLIIEPVSDDPVERAAWKFRESSKFAFAKKYHEMKREKDPSATDYKNLIVSSLCDREISNYFIKFKFAISDFTSDQVYALICNQVMDMQRAVWGN